MPTEFVHYNVLYTYAGCSAKLRVLLLGAYCSPHALFLAQCLSASQVGCCNTHLSLRVKGHPGARIKQRPRAFNESCVADILLGQPPGSLGRYDRQPYWMVDSLVSWGYHNRACVAARSLWPSALQPQLRARQLRPLMLRCTGASETTPFSGLLLARVSGFSSLSCRCSMVSHCPHMSDQCTVCFHHNDERVAIIGISFMIKIFLNSHFHMQRQSCSSASTATMRSPTARPARWCSFPFVLTTELFEVLLPAMTASIALLTSDAGKAPTGLPPLDVAAGASKPSDGAVSILKSGSTDGWLPVAEGACDAQLQAQAERLRNVATRAASGAAGASVDTIVAGNAAASSDGCAANGQRADVGDGICTSENKHIALGGLVLLTSLRENAVEV